MSILAQVTAITDKNVTISSQIYKTTKTKFLHKKELNLATLLAVLWLSGHASDFVQSWPDNLSLLSTLREIMNNGRQWTTQTLKPNNWRSACFNECFQFSSQTTLYRDHEAWKKKRFCAIIYCKSRARDLDLEHTLDARSPEDHHVQVWSQSSNLSRRRSDLRKTFIDR